MKVPEITMYINSSIVANLNALRTKQLPLQITPIEIGKSNSPARRDHAMPWKVSGTALGVEYSHNLPGGPWKAGRGG